MRGLVAALLLAAPAAAYQTDPRIELLGVVQQLSGERPNLPTDDAYRAEVEKSFAKFRTHPAVVSWRDAARKQGGMNGRAIALLYYSEPPELAPRGTPPYLEDPAEAAAFAAFLPALRDFAKRSDFMKFYAAHAKVYRRTLDAAAEELGVADPLAAVQEYVGLPLEAESRYLISPLFVPSHRNAYITPYPDPQTLPDPGRGKFVATTIMAFVPGQGPTGDVVTQRHRAALWQEPLFVFIDPALRAFDLARGGSAEAYYGASVAECRRNGADCAKNWLVAAITARLDTKAFGGPTNLPDGRDKRRDEYMTALAARLEEYEKDRAKYPTLWDFMPRLMAVFPEKAGLKAPPAPKLRKAATVKDLFR